MVHTTVYTARSLPAVFKGCLAVLLLTMPLISCSSSSSRPDNSQGQETLFVGTPECYLCHADGSLERFAGKKVVSRWLTGPHGNNESRDERFQNVDLYPDNTGFPYYGFGGLGIEPDCTLVCHDQLGDGALLEGFWNETGVEYLGRVNRPLVGCESCHGQGNSHFGIGGLQYPRPDPSRCGQCHNSDFAHNQFQPEGDNIYEDYLVSPHAGSIENPNYAGGSETAVRAICSKCHTDEGARLYRDVNGGHDELLAELGSRPPVEDATVVQCRTCHNPHNPHELLFDDLSTAGENVVQSAEYRTCTNCHQALGGFGLADGFHGENNGHAWSGGPPSFPVGVPPFDPAEIIYDTHFDNQDTPGIEGYNLGPVSNNRFGLASERVCRDCHNVHAADNTINEQWARSGHGGHIAEVKEAADHSDPRNILDAAVGGTDGSGSAFTFFNFATFAGGGCSRCHTASGARNYLDDPESYAPRDNEFSHLQGQQKELLYCWACHADNSGGLRNPGPISADYAGLPFAFPDLLGSNVCTACHTGRQSGQGIASSADDFTDKEFVDSHYLAAAGILFNAAGYEFAGRDYANSIYFLHDRVGLADSLQPNANGPCIGCHMKTEEGHVFQAVAKNATGSIVGLTSFEQTCSNCHTGPEELLDVVTEQQEGFQAALESLRLALADNGFIFLGAFPYFSNTDWTSLQDPSGKSNMGAAFNYNLLYHEPGAYSHNLHYTRKLLYDSIDFLDDGILNLSVESNLGPGKALDFLAGARP
ncbi:MAG: hypothetical protein R3297_05500 [Desulfobulbales bacterium]|nr:hypothetical protein [Desulfobulbales bacterium]